MLPGRSVFLILFISLFVSLITFGAAQSIEEERSQKFRVNIPTALIPNESKREYARV